MMAEKPGSSPLRRSARVNIRLPVKISGTNTDNKAFTEETQVLTVSKYGAKIKSAQALNLGVQLKVQPKGRKDPGIFRVVWIGKPGSPREGEVGIEYIQVSNLLGVAFPE
jgi:hypothetical protein